MYGYALHALQSYIPIYIYIIIYFYTQSNISNITLCIFLIDGPAAVDTPVPIRTPKLSTAGRGQVGDGCLRCCRSLPVELTSPVGVVLRQLVSRGMGPVFNSPSTLGFPPILPLISSHNPSSPQCWGLTSP